MVRPSETLIMKPCQLIGHDYRSIIQPAADSVENLRLARRWLSECQHNHKSCMNCVDIAPPTRLVDVGPADGSQDPRLLLTAEYLNREQDAHPGLQLPYLTLSHCWGQTPADAPWKTTQATLATFTTSIPIEALPKTLHDAIKITRSLGERYIWIDSLCIVQDSPDDWAKESARMGRVYSNSQCTIISSSDGADGGCFSERNVLEITPAALTLKTKDGTQTNKLVILPYPPTREVLVAASPTKSRAWCLQEATLSPRIIRFTKYQTLWECFESHASELAGDDFHDAPRERQEGCIFAVVDAHPMSIGWGANKLTAYNYWYSLVEDYSSRKLTYEEDKLPALSGMAQRMFLALIEDGKVSDRYIAGLWEQDLLVGLLWRRAAKPWQKDKVREENAEYVAPSWSWASTTESVEFCVNKALFDDYLGEIPWRPSTITCTSSNTIYGNSTPINAPGTKTTRITKAVTDHLKIDHVSIYPLTVNPFGQVHSGHLCAVGRLKQIAPKMVHAMLDEGSQSGKFKDSWSFPGRQGMVWFDFAFPVKDGAYPDIWCLLLQSWEYVTGGGVIGVGLALVPAPIEQNTTTRYRRIGYVEVYLSWFEGIEETKLIIV
jgi:hypothetical protein